MVERGRQVEADDSWKQKQWTVEQFQWMLTTFTEQVSITFTLSLPFDSVPTPQLLYGLTPFNLPINFLFIYPSTSLQFTLQLPFRLLLHKLLHFLLLSLHVYPIMNVFQEGGRSGLRPPKCIHSCYKNTPKINGKPPKSPTPSTKFFLPTYLLTSFGHTPKVKLPNLPLKLFFTYHLLRTSDISFHLVFINCSNQELALHHTICTWTYLKGGVVFRIQPPQMNPFLL